MMGRMTGALVKARTGSPLLLELVVIAILFHSLLLARGLLLGAETALFTAAEPLVSVHAFEQEFRPSYRDLRRVGGLNRDRRQLRKQTLNLLQLFQDGLRRLIVVNAHCAPQVEPLLDLLGVGAREILVEDL